MRKFIGLSIFLSLTQVFYAQEYYTSDFTFYQVETNPSATATSLLSNLVKSDFLFANNYSQQQLIASTFFTKRFIGLGLTTGNTNVSNNKYQKVGISLAYRNVLFSVLKFRTGIHYKFINNQSTSGVYSLYSFYEQTQSNYSKPLYNANYSISLSDVGNQFYVIAGKLNASLFNNPQNLFKEYSYITIGNLFNRYNAHFRVQVSYTLLQSSSSLGRNLNHNFKATYRSAISRSVNLFTSIKVGYWNNSIFQIKPAIAFYRIKAVKKTSGLIKFGVDIGINKKNIAFDYSPCLETSIQLKF